MLGSIQRKDLLMWGNLITRFGAICGVQVQGTDYKTPDGTCVRDYIHVTDLIDAHVKALNAATPGKPGIYNVATGQGGFIWKE